jgi:hypothetical protein
LLTDPVDAEIVVPGVYTREGIPADLHPPQ